MMQPSITLRRVMCIKSIEKIGITVTNSTTTFFQSDFDINKSFAIFSKHNYCIWYIYWCTDKSHRSNVSFRDSLWFTNFFIYRKNIRVIINRMNWIMASKLSFSISIFIFTSSDIKRNANKKDLFIHPKNRECVKYCGFY